MPKGQRIDTGKSSSKTMILFKGQPLLPVFVADKVEQNNDVLFNFYNGYRARIESLQLRLWRLSFLLLLPISS